MNPLREIRIVVAAPSTLAVVKMIPDTLEALQKEVGGNLEMYKIQDGLWRQFRIHCYVNEDGIQLDLKPNISTGRGFFILGNVIASKADGEGEEIGLTEHEAKFVCLFLDMLRGLVKTSAVVEI